MASKISKDTFDQVSRFYAEKLYHIGANGSTYNYDGGVCQGIELALNAAYGYAYDSKLDKDVSVAARVKERAEELVQDWRQDDERLNGEYLLNGGQRVRVERSWNPDFRELLDWSDDRGQYTYVGSKTIKNETVLDLIYNKILVKYVEPTLDELLTLPGEVFSDTPDYALDQAINNS